MAVLIDATAGGAGANSYVTLVEANAYVATRLNSDAWQAADDPGVALIEACRELQDLPWSGYRATGAQALQWPRTFAIDPDAPSFAWNYFLSTAVPQRVKDAQCELALQFLNLGTSDLAALDPSEGVQSERVDVLQTTYEPSAQRPLRLARFPRVMNRIRPLLTRRGNVSTIVRG